MKPKINIDGLPDCWEVVYVSPSNLNQIDPNHPNYNPIAERAVIQYTVHLKKKQHKDTDNMTKHEIEIEGLPKGWEAVAFRCPKEGESFVGYDGKVIIALSTNDLHGPRLIVKKKQPHRIVLEDTGRNSDAIKKGEYGYDQSDGTFYLCSDPSKWSHHYKVWREVKESDLSLHNADDNESLRLSVDECKQLLGYNDYDPAIYRKLHKFLKDR